MWQVYFDKHDSIALAAPDSGTASFLARLQAWSVTGKWFDVISIQPIPGTIGALCSM